MIKITKDTLRKLNAVVGFIDSDTGSVFEGFQGRLEMSDRLYHGELVFSDPSEEYIPDGTVSIKSLVPESTTLQPDVPEPIHIETTFDGEEPDGDS